VSPSTIPITAALASTIHSTATPVVLICCRVPQQGGG
jgi:hypothetical protein